MDAPDRGAAGQAPAVSILTAVYNEAQYIQECADSVLAQTVGDFEWIIVDDQSSDDTHAIVKAIDDPRITVLRNTAKGKVSAFNLAYAHARGPVYVLLGGDDIMPSDSLERRVTGLADLDAQTERAMLRGHVETFSEDARFDGAVLPKHELGNLSGGGIGFTRAIAERIFPIPEELPNEDTWIRLIAENFADTILPSPGVVLRYRIHDGNSSGSRQGFEAATKAWARRAKAYPLFLDRYREQLSPAQTKALSLQCDLEERRQTGSLPGIMGLRGASMADRLRTLSLAHPAFYAIRMRFWHLLTGLRK